MNNDKFYALVVTLSVSNSIKFIENLKQRFRGTISSNKYRSEIIAKPKDNNLNYMIDPTFRNISTWFVLSFKNSDDDPTRNSFDEFYMPLVKVKDFNALIGKKPFFDQRIKTNKRRMKNLSKYQETMIIEQEIY